MLASGHVTYAQHVRNKKEKHYIFNNLSYSICICLLFISTAIQANDIEKKNEIIAAAEKWLTIIDLNNYSQSRKEASNFFRGAVTEDQWIKSLDSVRTPLGKMISRKIQKKIFMKSLPGAPDVEYFVFIFTSTFENKKTAFEKVTFMKEQDAKWCAAGHYIN